MTTSRHYERDRKRRNEKIAEVGFGTIVKTVYGYNPKHKKYQYYDITDNAIIRVRDAETNIMVTQFFARANVIRRHWADCPQEILDKALLHQKMKLNQICC